MVKQYLADENLCHFHLERTYLAELAVASLSKVSQFLVYRATNDSFDIFQNYVDPTDLYLATLEAFLQYDYDIGSAKLGEAPKPSPGSDEVLIQVHAAALNPVDIRRSGLKIAEDWPIKVGYDLAGVVEAIGSDVTRFKEGDRVFGEVITGTLGPKTNGTVAEYCVSPSKLLAKIPDGFSFVQAAALPLVTETAIGVCEMAEAKEGDRMFITAGAGGVGIHLSQVAKNEYKVGEIATTVSQRKFEIVKKYGADIPVDYKTENAAEKLKDWADIVVDQTAEFDMGRSVLKPGGKHVTIHGVYGEDGVKEFLLEPETKLIEKVAEMLRDGKVIPIIDKVFDFKDSAEAMEYLADGHATGKVVIEVKK